MKRLPSFKQSLRGQRGDALIESLVAMVLMAIIGMGEVYVSSKAMVAQRQMRLQEISVSQMRAALAAHKMGTLNICSLQPAIRLPERQITATVNNCNDLREVTIRGVTVEVQAPLSLTVVDEQSDELGGAVTVGGTWE